MRFDQKQQNMHYMHFICTHAKLRSLLITNAESVRREVFFKQSLTLRIILPELLIKLSLLIFLFHIQYLIDCVKFIFKQ